MAKYKILTRSFIGNALHEEGDIVDYDGEVGDNLEPLDGPAAKRKALKVQPNSVEAEANDADLADLA